MLPISIGSVVRLSNCKSFTSGASHFDLLRLVFQVSEYPYAVCAFIAESCWCCGTLGGPVCLEVYFPGKFRWRFGRDLFAGITGHGQLISRNGDRRTDQCCNHSYGQQIDGSYFHF